MPGSRIFYGVVPKIAEFDFRGWHADPILLENFMAFGVACENYPSTKTMFWAEVATQNLTEIGHGYQDAGIKVTYPKKPKI